jgi:dTDP-4-amino-4,6-dideoxygalactose transaminase
MSPTPNSAPGWKVSFSGRGHAYTEREIEAVAAVMRSSDTLTQGRCRDAFETAFAAYLGVKHAFAVCNATAALDMAAQLCLFSPGDEVVIPGHTFTAGAYPFLRRGAVPVWADINPVTRVVTAETIERVLTPRTKAIVVTHLYGYLADMPPIMELAAARGCRVIEDAAQCLGARLAPDGPAAGSFGDFAAFSFHSHKNLTTLGEGGMFVTSDPEAAAILPLLRHNGHAPFAFEREHYWLPAMGNVDLPTYRGHPLIPNNYCLGEAECALGRLLLERVDAMNADRRRRALWAMDALDSHAGLLDFHREQGPRHVHHLLAARVGQGRRDAFIHKMAHDHGVQCVTQYLPLYRYDYYRKLGYGHADCPNADAFFDSMASFPFQHWMREADFVSVVAAADAVAKELA